MSRACWRCNEPVTAAASRCPACGARIIPLDAGSASPASTARRIWMAAGLSAAALVAFTLILTG